MIRFSGRGTVSPATATYFDIAEAQQARNQLCTKGYPSVSRPK